MAFGFAVVLQSTSTLSSKSIKPASKAHNNWLKTENGYLSLSLSLSPDFEETGLGYDHGMCCTDIFLFLKSCLQETFFPRA